MKNSFCSITNCQNSNQQLSKDELNSNSNEDFKVRFRTERKNCENNTLITQYNLFGRSLKLQTVLPVNYSQTDDLKLLLTKLGYVLSKVFNGNSKLMTKSDKTQRENNVNLDQRSIQERQQILSELICFRNSFNIKKHKKINVDLFPEVSKQKNKLLSNFEIYFDSQQEKIDKSKIFKLWEIKKLISLTTNIKKNSQSMNKWIFMNFLPIIQLKDLQNIQCFEFRLSILTTKHRNIEIGVTPANTTIQYANSCSIHRISFHLRNLEIFDHFQNQDKSKSNKWRKNPLKNDCQNYQNSNVRVKIMKTKSGYQIVWEVNEIIYAKSTLTQYLIDNGFKFCIGMFHVDDCVITNFQINQKIDSKSNRQFIRQTDQESQPIRQNLDSSCQQEHTPLIQNG